MIGRPSSNIDRCEVTHPVLRVVLHTQHQTLRSITADSSEVFAKRFSCIGSGFADFPRLSVKVLPSSYESHLLLRQLICLCLTSDGRERLKTQHTTQIITFQHLQTSRIRPHPMRALALSPRRPVLDPLHIPPRDTLQAPFLLWCALPAKSDVV